MANTFTSIAMGSFGGSTPTARGGKGNRDAWLRRFWRGLVSSFFRDIFRELRQAKPEIDFFEMATRKVSMIVAVRTYPPDWSGGLPVSSDGRWLHFLQVDAYSSNRMLELSLSWHWPACGQPIPEKREKLDRRAKPKVGGSFPPLRPDEYAQAPIL